MKLHSSVLMDISYRNERNDKIVLCKTIKWGRVCMELIKKSIQ